MRALSIPFLQRRLRPESIREVVFGVEDGAVQNMALIAGMAGAGLAGAVIVLAGSINVIAGVLSMSMGTYLSSQAERDALLAAGGDGSVVVRSPLRDAAVMAVAYAGGGLVPVIPFVFPFLERSAAAVVAVTLTASTLFGLGVVKGVVSRQPAVFAGARLLVLAAAAGIAGYLIGVAAQAVFGIAV